MMRCSSQQGLSPNPCAHIKIGDDIVCISMQTTRVSKALVLILCLHGAKLSSDVYGFVHQNIASKIDCEHNNFLTSLNSI